MKTEQYNPSPLEIAVARSIKHSSDFLNQKLENLKIVKVEDEMEKDNPLIVLHLIDGDNDPHEIVLRIIQRPDTF